MTTNIYLTRIDHRTLSHVGDNKEMLYEADEEGKAAAGVEHGTHVTARRVSPETHVSTCRVSPETHVSTRHVGPKIRGRFRKSSE